MSASAVLSSVYKLVTNYVKASYQNDPFRTLLEGFLLAFVMWYVGTRAYRPNETVVKLTPKEIDELCDEWQPEPLVNEGLDLVSDRIRSLDVPCGSSSDFLGLRDIQSVKESAKNAVRHYGVGTCGPAGFYGTLDIHQKLQNKLAGLFQAEAALVLAQGVIPAFCKRSDVIIADECVNFAIQRGITLSRSRYYYVRHNDMHHLEQVMREVDADQKKRRVPLTRRFVITEGLFTNGGDVANLPAVLELSSRYRYRVILDESMALGVLGASGRGTCDHFGIEGEARKNIIFVGALSNAMGSAGGFTAGSKIAIDHQILSNQAYCYSASLPALFAAAALEALRLVPPQIPKLRAAIKAFDAAYQRHAKDFSLKGFILIGQAGLSPLRYLQNTSPEVRQATELQSMQRIVKHMAEKQWQISLRHSSADEHLSLRPAIRVCVTVDLKSDDFVRALVASLP